MTYGSRQGINIAFVGMNAHAQTACAEYLVRTYWFKRVDMDMELKRFLRQMYYLKPHIKIALPQKRAFYDAIYKLDPEIFIDHFKRRAEMTDQDIVVVDVRYLNELKVLQELGFKIVRVTTDLYPKIGVYVKSAGPGTVALASMYDKSFAFKNNVEYSIHVNDRPSLSGIIDPMLARMGYKLTK